MSDLPARIEAGVATDAEVAVALGFIHKATFAAPGEGWFDGDTLVYPGPANNPPPFTTCLTTLAKECERRGLRYCFIDWWKERDPVEKPHRTVTVRKPGRPMLDAATSDGTYVGDCRALCAALVRAVEGETR